MPKRIDWYNADGLRYCTGCQDYMEVALFYRNRAVGTPDGLHRRCRVCMREPRHAVYQRRRAQAIADALTWQAAHPERTRETHRLASRVYHYGKRLAREMRERREREEQAG